jgi:hypothetical protein
LYLRMLAQNADLAIPVNVRWIKVLSSAGETS